MNSQVVSSIPPKAHTGERPRLGLNDISREVVDAPRFYGVGQRVYEELAEELRALPQGKALKLTTARPDTPRALAARLRVSFRAERPYRLKLHCCIAEDYVLVWENRQ